MSEFGVRPLTSQGKPSATDRVLLSRCLWLAGRERDRERGKKVFITSSGMIPYSGKNLGLLYRMLFQGREVLEYKITLPLSFFCLNSRNFSPIPLCVLSQFIWTSLCNEINCINPFQRTHSTVYSIVDVLTSCVGTSRLSRRVTLPCLSWSHDPSP